MDNPVGIPIAIFGPMFILVGVIGNLVPLSLPAQSMLYVAAIIALYYKAATSMVVYYALMMITFLVVVAICAASLGLIVGGAPRF